MDIKCISYTHPDPPKLSDVSVEIIYCDDPLMDGRRVTITWMVRYYNSAYAFLFTTYIQTPYKKSFQISLILSRMVQRGLV